mgnify:FL=1
MKLKAETRQAKKSGKNLRGAVTRKNPDEAFSRPIRVQKGKLAPAKRKGAERDQDEY